MKTLSSNSTGVPDTRDFGDCANWQEVEPRFYVHRVKGGLDLDKTRAAMRRVASESNIDLGGLLYQASLHFGSDTLQPAPTPTDSEMRELVDDELRFLDE